MSTDPSTHGNQPFHSDADAAQKLEALRNDRSQGQPRPTGGQTYLSKAQQELGSELGGRYAHLGRETTVVGARPLELDTSQDGHSALALQRERMAQGLPHYPRQEHPFACDVGNIEPAFPINVNALPDMETVDGK